MVAPGRKRVRDYAAERQRRNAEARRWGFTSLDQMSKARRRGDFPSAAELRRDPTSGHRAKQRLEDREMQAFDRTRSNVGLPGFDSKRSRFNARDHDRESQQWSDAHARQTHTTFNKRWSAAKKEDYYQTFVRPWGKKRSREQQMAYHDWAMQYDPDYDGRDNPYADM